MACRARLLVHPKSGQVLAVSGLGNLPQLAALLRRSLPEGAFVEDSTIDGILVLRPWCLQGALFVVRHPEILRDRSLVIYPTMPGWRLPRMPRQAKREAPPRTPPEPTKTPRAELARALGTLGLTAAATLREATRAYRRLALQRHPDRGGSLRAMQELNDAWRRVKGAMVPRP